MVVSFLILLFYIVFLSCFKEKTYYYIFNIGVLLFGTFFCAKFDPSSSSLVYHLFAIGMFLPIFPYLRKYINFILIPLALLIIYILLKFIGWQIDIMRMFMDLRISIFAVCMGLAMVEDIKRGRLNIKLLVKWMYIFVLIQIVLAWVQYFIPSLSTYFVENPESGADATDRAIKLNMNILTGTLLTPSALSGFLVVSLFVLMVYELENKSVNYYKILFMVFAIGVTFLCGIRTPFFFFVIFTAIYFFIYQKKLFYSFLPAFIVMIAAMVTAATMSHEGAVGRMLEGFTQISSGLEGLQGTTLVYSILMRPYFFQNPIFGVSLGADRYMIFGGYALSDMSITDAYLMYILCEYGLIGLSLFLYPFFKMKKIVLKSSQLTFMNIKKSTVILFVAYGICLAIVDKGIFHYLELVLLITGIILFSYKRRDEVAAKVK